MRVITRELCWAQLQALDEMLQRTQNEKRAAAIELQRNWWSDKLGQILEHDKERVFN
jgi:hypothetical protein